MKAIALLLVLVAAMALAIQGSAGPYRINLRTEPAVIPVGRAKLVVKLTDSAGKPVTGATVKVFAQMPGMPMGEREETATPSADPGTYTAPAVFGMAGAYDAKISITGSLGTGQTTISLSTGEDTESGSSFPLGAVILCILAIGGTVLIIRQVRRSGQVFSWRSIVNRQVLTSLVLLGAALAVAVWAIHTFRRPGSMTPLEAQVMDMNAPAPEGTLPVRLAKVETKPFSSTVTYTGQAIGFVEQDVVTRVTGAIVWMPFYVGNKISKGQVLARLDTTQIDPMVSEKAAQSAAASQGVDIAQSDYQRALADVSQAQAEQAIREGAIDEAKAMVTAAEQERSSAEANLRMEQASVVDAQSQVTAAAADRDYWAQELARTNQLYDKGAVSKDELQKTQASASAASAKVRQTNAGVDAANARVQAARAAVRKASAGVVAAQNKQREVQAEHHAHMAHVKSAQAAADAARKRISQASSEVQMAQAGLAGAATQRGYSELKSEVDGVVTARVISPGVVVSPGQTVLKVAQITPIRLQANVPESDLAHIQLGAIVKVKRRDGNEPPLVLKVTSVSPSVDPNSRIGVVEALYANSDGRFVPGQYISMEIALGGVGPAMVIPSDAVRTEESRSYVWVAEAAMNGEFTVSRHEVQLGGRADDEVAITSGLEAGQQVVVSPPPGLAAGTRVVSSGPTSPPSPTDLTSQTIEITAAGYVPPSIDVPVGKAFKVTFIRRDDKTCGTEVIFPDLNIRRLLPLNVPITIDFPPQAAGKELNFTCPMNMLKGKAVAR
ncbi:MAG: efflux RND transporter periplasmic adaptor subunit [Fimbriimonadales bacterium]